MLFTVLILSACVSWIQYRVTMLRLCVFVAYDHVLEVCFLFRLVVSDHRTIACGERASQRLVSLSRLALGPMSLERQVDPVRLV